MKLIYERSQPGRRASRITAARAPVPELPEELARERPPRLRARRAGADAPLHRAVDPELRHRHGLLPARLLHDEVQPARQRAVVGLPGFRDLHPLQEEDGAQGALELMWRLQEILAEVAGLPGVSLQPAAGSQGEVTGLMLMRAYFEERGEDEQRRGVVVPDTAHGTNPASVTMAGYELVGVQTDARGNIDVEDLRAKVDETTAGLMLTNPSTLGLFDENIEEIQRIFHGAGALMYFDGANLNAVCGISRPGDMGFDIVHINLHKTFSQPHGGGGPGGGPIAVRDVLEPYLPCRRSCARATATATTTTDRSRSARCAASPARSASSSARTRSCARGARRSGRCPRSPCSTRTTCSRGCATRTSCRTTGSACTSSSSRRAPLKREHGVSALDVAKRLMDYGFHPPTVYFPLVVPEALMIEPTETEAKETLDAFADAMVAIAREAAEDPETLKAAPHGRAVGRLDEVKAAKRAVVRYRFEEHPDLSAEPRRRASRPPKAPSGGDAGPDLPRPRESSRASSRSGGSTSSPCARASGSASSARGPARRTIVSRGCSGTTAKTASRPRTTATTARRSAPPSTPTRRGSSRDRPLLARSLV